MIKKFNNCQSCGMPLDKDEKTTGTEINGSLSEMYCIHCYENGKFTSPDITLIEMRELVSSKMLEMHLPQFVAKFLTRNISTLKRWNK
jgi:hypothetical protein